MIFSSAMLLWASSLCAGAGYAQQLRSAEISPVVRERILGLVPSPAPASAAAQDKPAFYDASTLYQYIDGAADVFQAYDVETVFHQDYKAGPVDITVDIFDMRSLENAFGMYASERSPRYDFLPIGTEGYWNEGVLNFFQGRYYVKLAAFGEGADRVLRQFAVVIAERIGAKKEFPVFLAKLPSADRKPRTELYQRTDPLGQPFLSPAFQAVYTFEGAESTLLVTPTANESASASRLSALADHFRQTGRWNPAPEFGAGASRGSNSFEGTAIAATSGRFLVILLNPAPRSEAFFRDAVMRFRSPEKE